MTDLRSRLTAIIDGAVDSAAFRYQDAERAAAAFDFAVDEAGEYACRCNACGWRGVGQATKQAVVQEAARHVSDCAHGWLLTAYTYTGGTWKLRPEVGCG